MAYQEFVASTVYSEPASGEWGAGGSTNNFTTEIGAGYCIAADKSGDVSGEYEQGHFSIPIGSTIDGIRVENLHFVAADNNDYIDVEIRDATGTWRSYDSGNQYAGGATGCPACLDEGPFPSGTTELWGGTWTAEHINSGPDFRIRITARAQSKSGGFWRVDYALIRVYFTPPVNLSASRIANATRVDQSGSDDNPVTGWNKANDFIVGTQIWTEDGTIDSAYKLQFREISAPVTYYFDGSDVAASDIDAVWTDETNTDDGATGTYAYTATQGTEDSNEIQVQGTNAPGSGGTIAKVEVRAFGYVTDDGDQCSARVYTDGGAATGENLGRAQILNQTPGAWSDWVELSVPSGEWDWATVQALEVAIYASSIAAAANVYCSRVEVRVTAQGAWTDVAVAGPIRYTATTDLTDDGTLTSGEKLCSGVPSGASWADGLENEGDNVLPDSGTFSLTNDYYSEFQWGIDGSNGTDDVTYQFRLYDTTQSFNTGPALATITFSTGPTQYTKTWTTDAYLQEVEQTKTFTTDAWLKTVGLTKTFTTDAYLVESYTKTFTTDAFLQAFTQTKTFTTDAYLQEQGLKTFTTDAWLQTVGLTKTFTSDGYLQESYTKAFTTDAWLATQETKTFTTDAFLQALTQTKTFTCDAYLAGAKATKTFTTDAFLQAFTLTKTWTLDGYLQESFTKTFTTDAWLATQEVKTFTCDAYLQEQGTKTWTTDAWLAASGVTKTFTVDGYLQEAFTKVFTVDGYLLEAYIKTFTSDAFLKAITQTKTFTTDAFLKALTQTKAWTCDAYLTAPGAETKTWTADAYLQEQNIKTFTTDAWLFTVGLTKTFTADAYLTETGVKTWSIDAYLVGTSTKTFTTDAILKATGLTKTFTTDAWLSGGTVKTFTVDAYLQKQGIKTFAVDAMLIEAQAKTFTVDAYLTEPGLKTFAVDAYLQETFTVTVTADAYLKAVVTFTCDAYLQVDTFLISFKKPTIVHLLDSNNTIEPLVSSVPTLIPLIGSKIDG